MNGGLSMVNTDDLKMKLREAINKTEKELNNNKNLGWEKQYRDYAEKMLINQDEKSELRKKIHECEPFKYYLTVGKAKNGRKNLELSVRYSGQEIADMYINERDIKIDTTKYDEKNKRDFECDISLKKANWNSNEAKLFREYFKINKPIRIDGKRKNEEHRIESALLTEFSKKCSNDKLLCGIQPITFAGVRLPMPTAISASDIIKFGGGHIDILARTTGRKITVIELKDENVDKEPIEKVLTQATAYSIFLLNLLRSDYGKQWYEIFGFKGDIPKTLVIRVCAAMPVKKDGSYDKFDSFEIKYKNDILEYHWLYFEEQDKEIKKINTSINKSK